LRRLGFTAKLRGEAAGDVFMRNFMFASLFFISPAFAGADSAYTDFDIKKCKQLTPLEEGQSSGDYECAGYKGVPYYFAEDDLRSFLAFGNGGQEHCAFQQTFNAFNTSGEKIEWRLIDGKPIATILRWNVSYDPSDTTKIKSWLVVTKLEDGDSCHAGYVEGSLPNANQEARTLADVQAVTGSCKVIKPIYLAVQGTSVENMTTAGACK
jgi:hypothetical protein